MLRRTAIPVLFAGCAWSAPSPLGRFFDSGRGSALLLDIPDGRLLAVHHPAVAAAAILPPGSTLKPLVLSALLRRKKLTTADAFACSGRLTIAGRQLNCTHPPLGTPLDLRAAIAYSCNGFIAQYAQRFQPGELSADLAAAGLSSLTGLLDRETAGRISAANPQLQALGEDGVLVTAAGLAMAYRRLARACDPAILEGLQNAVEFGTAQRARVDGLRVAGKTGSTRDASGARIAWFAGFTSEVAIVVMLQGRSGGSDAAPIAARILDAHRAGRL